jgi:hypothetical protein
MIRVGAYVALALSLLQTYDFILQGICSSSFYTHRHNLRQMSTLDPLISILDKPKSLCRLSRHHGHQHLVTFVTPPMACTSIRAISARRGQNSSKK